MTQEELRAYHREYNRKWRLENPDKVAKYKRKWRRKKANRKKETEYHRQWTEKNREHVRAYYAKWAARKVLEEIKEKENET